MADTELSDASKKKNIKKFRKQISSCAIKKIADEVTLTAKFI